MAADLFCELSSKLFLSVSANNKQLHLVSPEIVRFKNFRNNKQFFVTTKCRCNKPFSELSVISTHEHSDGTLLFRFGDGKENRIQESDDGNRNAVFEIDHESITDTDGVLRDSSPDPELIRVVDVEQVPEDVKTSAKSFLEMAVEATQDLPQMMTMQEIRNSAETIFESQEVLKNELYLSSGAAMLPHPSELLTGREDAYFVTGETWLGVADGVSLWSFEGTKPGVFAQEVVKNCKRLIEASHCDGNAVDTPLQLLIQSVAETHSPGSSTLLVSRFDGQALHVANVGDSRFLVLRDGIIYQKSSPMNHLFHFPHLIHNGDDPSSVAETYDIDLTEGDVIITATDGLFDNLYDEEISSIAFESISEDKSLEEIAVLLATRAQEIGRSSAARTPHSDEAEAAGFSTRSGGGRLDDVTVIVSRVERRR